MPRPTDRNDYLPLELGRLVATPGALDVLNAAGQQPSEFLDRHKVGDWGIIDSDDRQVNDDAIRDKMRVLSAYKTRLEQTIWIITEWDRSVTTILLPSEY